MSDDHQQRLASILDLAATYCREGRSNRRSLAIDYLLEIAELLSETTNDQKILAPLLDLIPFVAEADSRLPFEERRNSSATASDELMVRVVTAVEILEDCGYSWEAAAQHVTRQIVRAGAALPAGGGDPRAWKRLLFWRDRLLHLRSAGAAWPLYEAFKTEVGLMPRERVVSAAIDGRLWNLRAAGKTDSAAA